MLIRTIFKRQFHATRWPGNVKKESQDTESLIYQKLKLLAEESREIDNSIHIVRDSLPKDKLLEDLKTRQFQNQYAKEISYTKIPNYVDRQSKAIAISTPWTGTESNYDVNLRMLSDSHKPLRSKVKPKRKISVRDRLHNARENSLDYTLAKIATKPKKADDGWSERYREALLGPELLGPVLQHTSLTAISGLVDRKIEDARNRGAFLNLPNRGKPIPKDHNSNSPYIDKTEYYLNNILKGQDIVPPWIDKQGSVQLELRKFHNDLDQMWLQKAVIILKDKYGNLGVDKVLERLRMYSENEINGGEKLRDQDWVQEHDLYFTKKIALLNDSLRGYNLQAPMASQKFYLLKDRELEMMFQRVNTEKLYDGTKRFLLGRNEVKELKPLRNGTYLKYGELPQSVVAPRDGQETLGELFLNMFKQRN